MNTSTTVVGTEEVPAQLPPSTTDEIALVPESRMDRRLSLSQVLAPVILLAVFIGIAVFMAVWQIRSRSAEQASFAAEMDKLIVPPAAGPVNAMVSCALSDQLHAQ